MAPRSSQPGMDTGDEAGGSCDTLQQVSQRVTFLGRQRRGNLV
ncbi:MAG: hypothetical protein QOI01_5920, partial [Mycobacterium sp.]|nr:hypothetical protein [Mycobacterium sp.]